MPITVTLLRIFVASPGDVAEERQILEDVVRELNLTLPEQLGLRLELVKWETHAYPGLAEDAQSVINKEIGDSYDIFIGILWARFGTPTARATSGTAEEFERAFERWNSDPNSIRIMFYFKISPISPKQIDLAQLGRVQQFREHLGGNGLYWEFDGPDNFATLLRVHLMHVTQDWKKTIDENRSRIVARTAVVGDELSPNVEAIVPEDEGFLELTEAVMANSERTGAALSRIGEAMNTMNTKLTEAQLDIDAVLNLQGDNRTKIAAYKRATNKFGQVMADFNTRMKTEVPIIQSAQDATLDSYGKLIRMLPEFGQSGNVEFLSDSLAAITTLQTGMSAIRNRIASMRSSVAKLPRVTNYFAGVQRGMVAVLDEFLVGIDRGLNVTPEIAKTLQDAISSTKNTPDLGAKIADG